MKGNKFNQYEAVIGITDVRHLVAIMFGNTDLLFIKRVLEESGYPFGSPERFSEQLRDVHKMWIENEKDIDKVNGYFGMVDPFNKLKLEPQSELTE